MQTGECVSRFRLTWKANHAACTHQTNFAHSTRKGEQTSAKTDTGEMVAIASGYTHGTALLEQSRAI